MAVYTSVTASDLATFLAGYDLGHATSFKGIAEGVSNSNFLVDTSSGRYFLTLFERNIDVADLPWFLALMTHLADKGLPVPRPVRDAGGKALQTLNARPACLITFLTGVSVTEPTPAECHAVGAALGQLHTAGADFADRRANSLGQVAWPGLPRAAATGWAKSTPRCRYWSPTGSRRFATGQPNYRAARFMPTCSPTTSCSMAIASPG